MKVEVKGYGPVEIQDGATYADVAAAVGERGALAVAEGGAVYELFRPVTGQAEIRLLTFDDEEGRRVFRHTTAHVLAQAVKRLYPDAQLAIGPAIDEGFYYDILFPEKITPEAFPAIEAEMGRIVAEALPLKRREIGHEEALRYFKERGEGFKVALIEDLPEDTPLTFYRQGDFEDLCRGPHLASTGPIKAFKLTSLAGAYWRGDERNAMLQRIYGTSYPDPAQLEHHLWLAEEAKRRDHRRLGPELDLFTFHEVAPGFTFWHPKGVAVYESLVAFSRELQEERGYREVATPWIMRLDLWNRSGHSDHYRENMFLFDQGEEVFGAKPMNCPGHCVLFGETTRSYRDLPLRLAEYGPLSRYERSGTLHGLLRVRGFHQDDAHIFAAPENIGDVVGEVMELIGTIYDTLGLPYDVRFATRPENYMGELPVWEEAEAALEGVLKSRGLPYQVAEGDGTFYGPKLDFYVTDALGRRWQCATVQLDFQMPRRFNLAFVNREGREETPVMIHRAVIGSLERFIGILTEHFAGAFPTWLAPVAVKVLPITDAEVLYARSVVDGLRQAGVRVELDERNEKVGYKIRQAQAEKVPYMAVIGKREAEAGTVAVRSRSRGDLGTRPMEAFIGEVHEEVQKRRLEGLVAGQDETA